MRAPVVVLLIAAACGRLGFEPSAGDDGTGDGGPDGSLPEVRWLRVAIGRTLGCGIDVERALWCWGKGEAAGTSGDSVRSDRHRVGDATTWDAISARERHVCAIQTDGSLWCWGLNLEGGLGVGPISAAYAEPQHVSPGSSWKKVSVGVDFTCAIKSDDTLWCWGMNDHGQLGLGSTTNADRPTQVGTATWKDIDAGLWSACGLQSDGIAWCWGRSNEGQLGTGSLATSTVPVQVNGSVWSSITVGSEHACGRKPDGTVYCWGRNYEGQLGDGSQARRPMPIQPPTTGVQVEVIASAAHTCARSHAGVIECWGDSTRGRLPGTDQMRISLPARIDGPIATQLILGEGTTCVIDDDARLHCSGWNQTGQSGAGGGEDYVFTRSDTRTDWQSIAAHASQTCGVTTSGEVECWGRGTYGQIGDGAQVDRQVPTRTGVTANRVVVSRDATFSVANGTVGVWGFDMELQNYALTPRMFAGAIAAGSTLHTCMLAGTELRCLGRNDSGQLGDGTTTYRGIYGAVPGLWADLAVDETVTCATSAGTRLLSCWGFGPRTGTGNAGDVLSPTRVTAIAGAVTKVELSSGGCAIEAPGALWCWGRNAFGQVGDGTLVDRLTAVRVGARTDWVDVDLGDYHTCGITADGALWCWGHADEGHHGDGPHPDRTTPVQIGTATDWRDVACGDHYTCALKTDGTRWCAGNTWWGELGNGRAWHSTFTLVP